MQPPQRVVQMSILPIFLENHPKKIFRMQPGVPGLKDQSHKSPVTNVGLSLHVFSLTNTNQ